LAVIKTQRLTVVTLTPLNCDKGEHVCSCGADAGPQYSDKDKSSPYPRNKQLLEIDRVAGFSSLVMLKNSRYAKFLAGWVGQKYWQKAMTEYSSLADNWKITEVLRHSSVLRYLSPSYVRLLLTLVYFEACLYQLLFLPLFFCLSFSRRSYLFSSASKTALFIAN
jgi:hypothetical protein